MTTIAYTDGACSGNPGPGGWAWAVPGGSWGCGPDPQTTNQRMEIMAAYEAVQALPGRLEVVSDSTYVVHCFRDRWWESWIAKGWINKARKPVANRDLWEPFVDLVRVRGDVTFRWVKGHSGDPMNDLVDRLAVEAAVTQQGRHGTEPPTDLGPPDRITRTRAAAPREAPAPAAPELPGTPLVVFGHKPTELGGYQEDNPVIVAVRARLREILVAKHQLHPDLAVVSGLRLGAEMAGAEAALEAEIPLVVVLPYPNPQKPWPKEAKVHFQEVCDRAIEVITLQKREPANKQQAGAALARRDAWLARHAREAVLVWDGQDQVLGRLARSLEDHLGDDVWVVDPTELTPAPRPGR